MHIYDYLCGQAETISRGAPRAAASFEQWMQQRPRRLQQFHEMMGLTDRWLKDRRVIPETTVTGGFERDGYRVENLYFQSLPRLYVAGNLYVPNARPGERLPAVLYLCGHSESPRAYYQAHARRFAKLGFVALVIDTIHMGELQGYHHGLFRENWWHWYSRGYTPAGVELLNAIAAIDLLQSLPYVDGVRIGVTGISGGGATSWWIAAGDERVACVAPVCATGTFASQVIDRTIDAQCDCMFPINAYGWDLVDIAALVAPRPCLIASADRDRIFTIASVREFHERLKRVYEMVGAVRNLELVETPGRHSYHPHSRTAIFSWFLRHLAGNDKAQPKVDDVDLDDELDDSLRVFACGTPRDEITTTIQDSFIEIAEPPVVTDAASHSRHRDAVIAALREKTFAHFPEEPCPPDPKIEFEWALEDRHGTWFSFAAEAHYRLWANLTIMNVAGEPGPVIVSLQNVRDKGIGQGVLGEILPDWLQASIEVRGTGRTSWGEDLHRYVRRAAMLTGRTVASMRVWDTLRALAAVRQLPEVDPDCVAVAGSGEMAVVVLYAALLDGKVRAVILHNPPPTQDVPGNRHGMDDAIEMLNCLRVTDLPQVAGLLFPAELIFVGPRPTSYRWAEELYSRLGGRVSHVAVKKPLVAVQ